MKSFKNNKLNQLNIGFMGVGLMGEGMVCKLIDAGFNVYVKKNKNPKPIERVKLKGRNDAEGIVVKHIMGGKTSCTGQAFCISP